MGACSNSVPKCCLDKMPMKLAICAFASSLVLIILCMQNSQTVQAEKGMGIDHNIHKVINMNHSINANPFPGTHNDPAQNADISSNVALSRGHKLLTASIHHALKPTFEAIDRGTKANPRKTANMNGNAGVSDINIASSINGALRTTFIRGSNPTSTILDSEAADASNGNNYTSTSDYIVCRCLPDAACWPSLDEWNKLNNSVGGQLLIPRPPALPCYPGPTQNITACQIAAINWINPFWRADQVGAMQYSNKEAHGNQSCSLFSGPIISTFDTSLTFGSLTRPTSISTSFIIPSSDTSSAPTSPQCQQGAVAEYAIEVLNSSHVQAAVTFATQHNLRLSIKSTGHDALGRSTAPGSLNLWMHRMKNITFHENFTPSGCDADMTFPAVTAESGTQWGEVYTAAEAKNLVVVGAMSASVSTGGGFLQGGGHSPLSPFLGLAADNVVEIKVVTADGRLLTANRCQNRDLFWAMRGGGGGTFGVVISSTHITYPPLLNVVNVHFTATSSNATLFEELLVNFVYLQSSLSEDNFWAGYSYISSKPQPSLTINYLVPNCNTSIAQDSFRTLLNFTSQYSRDFTTNLTISAFPSFKTWHSQVLCDANPGICTDPSGLNTVLASRLLPQSVLQGKAPQVAQAFMKILSGGVGQIVGHLVGGQAVTAGQNLAGQDRLNLLNKLGHKSLYVADDSPSSGQTHKHVSSADDVTSRNYMAREDRFHRSANKDDLANHHLTSGNNAARKGAPTRNTEDVFVASSNNGAQKDSLARHSKGFISSVRRAAPRSDVDRGQARRFHQEETDVPSRRSDPLIKNRLDASRAVARETLRQYEMSSGATDAHNASNSVNPAFRRALWHVVLLNVWGYSEREGSGIPDSQSVTQMNGLLRDLSPGSGCYLNEADVNEPNWQDAYYGQHYKRLVAIKERVDPQGLFTCTNCVGSEQWTTDDNQRLCRRRPIV